MEKGGTISDVQVVRRVDPALDSEATLHATCHFQSGENGPLNNEVLRVIDMVSE
jgi:hypothetical protein